MRKTIAALCQDTGQSTDLEISAESCVEVVGVNISLVLLPRDVLEVLKISRTSENQPELEILAGICHFINV
jgi:hypothetical protein